MGECIKVVSINGTAYIINSGHDNNDIRAINIAIEKHTERLKNEEAHYTKYDIRDKGGCPIYADYTIDQIFVCDGIIIN